MASTEEKITVTIQVKAKDQELPAYVFTVDHLLLVPGIIMSECTLRAARGDVVTGAEVSVVF
jgi:low temperature requirement protein LtrA